MLRNDQILARIDQHLFGVEDILGRALASEARELAEAGTSAADGMLRLAGGSPGALTGEVVATAARAGDVAAIDICASVGRC